MHVKGHSNSYVRNMKNLDLKILRKTSLFITEEKYQQVCPFISTLDNNYFVIQITYKIIFLHLFVHVSTCIIIHI